MHRLQCPFRARSWSDEVAGRTLMKMQINSTVARQLVDACLDFAKTQPNGLAPTRSSCWRRPATSWTPTSWTACSRSAPRRPHESPDRALRAHAIERGRLAIPDARRPRHSHGSGPRAGLSYYFVGGGLPIVVENQLIGAMGVGGGNMDEMCAYTALTKVLGPQKPLPAPAARGGGAGGNAPAGGGSGQGGAGGRGGAAGSSSFSVGG